MTRSWAAQDGSGERVPLPGILAHSPCSSAVLSGRVIAHRFLGLLRWSNTYLLRWFLTQLPHLASKNPLPGNHPTPASSAQCLPRMLLCPSCLPQAVPPACYCEGKGSGNRGETGCPDTTPRETACPLPSDGSTAHQQPTARHAGPGCVTQSLCPSRCPETLRSHRAQRRPS